MDYTKQPIDYPEQIAMLRRRGLIIADEEYAIRQLGIISYFRLASYWKPMEMDKASHIFKPKSTFENAVSLYYFDKNLRALLFKVVQSIEIALRTKVIHHIGMKYGAFWFADESLATNPHMFANNLAHIQAELSRSREDFILEHNAKYIYPPYPPVWKTLEVVSFGTLSKLLENFSDRSVKKIIAAEFNLPHRKFLESWIKSISGVRNYIAHHARVWNRKYPYKPLMPQRLPNKWIEVTDVREEKLYAQLCVLKYLEDAIHPHNKFASELKNLIRFYSNVDVVAMGFSSDWESQPLWASSD